MRNKMKNFDLIIIGSGAGFMVAQAAMKHGWNCALIEEAKVGGTCLNRGCIPSKILVHPADCYHRLISDPPTSFGLTHLKLRVSSIAWRGHRFGRPFWPVLAWMEIHLGEERI